MKQELREIFANRLVVPTKKISKIRGKGRKILKKRKNYLHLN